MWKSLRLKNFRLFEDTGKIDLAPMTILIGPNGSGKSSFISSLLLLRQSAQAPSLGTPIVTDGPYANLGSPDDIINKNSDEHSFSIEVGYGNKPEGEACFKIKWAVKDSIASVDQFSYSLGEKSIVSVKNNVQTQELKITSELYNFSAEGKDDLRRFYEIPISLVNLENKQLISDLKEAQNNFVHNANTTLFVSSRRSEIQQIYSKGNAPMGEVGSGAENVPEMLRYSTFYLDRLNQSLEDMGLPVSIRTHSSEGRFSLLSSWKSMGPRPINLALESSGLKYLIPILLQAIVAQENYTVILEEPENNLNPKLQAELGGLLFGFTLPERPTPNRHIIVETHSEHFISRIRTMIAKSEGKISPDRIAVYYFDKDKIQRININDFGQFTNWPRGFFEEEWAETMELTKANIERKKKEKVAK